MFLLAHPKASNFELKSPTNRKVADGLKKWKMRVSIWAVDGSQSEVLVARKFKIDGQGFVFGYDIEISIPKFFVYN